MSPFEIAAIKALDRAIESVQESDFTDAVITSRAVDGLRTIFQQNLSAAVKAFAACSTGRQIQVAALKDEVREALDVFTFDVLMGNHVPGAQEEFWSMVGPHFKADRW